MKVLLFVLLAGYAVRCDDNNYYVIEMLDDPPPKPFKVYWNVPSMQCRSKKIPFNNLFEKFGIIQNEDDKFQGDKVTILYDPGLFPALLKNETSGRFKFRNGGVPQEGDLDKHLTQFKEDLDLLVPDDGFDGIGIIDFESWRPVYRQNFGALQPYKDVSVEIERRRHWWWQTKWLQAEAKQRFEDAARTFMQSTLSIARQLRPKALWGFYGFPYCFNMASNNMNEACASNVPQENNNISWLWQESTALYPSVYSSVDLTTSQLAALVRGRVKEAARFGSLVLPYFWYRYRDAGFLSETDLNAALSTLYKSNASGFIIWGSSSDVNTVDKCNKLLNYIENVMGPAIAKYTQSRAILDAGDTNDTVVNRVTMIDNSNDSDSIITTNSPSDITKRINPDPEYHWVPPENYTQTIKDHVAEEISKKRANYSVTDNSVFSNSVLIDLILNAVVVSNSDNESTNSSNVDSTTKIGVRESEESDSSTTTEARAFEAETTSVTTDIVTSEDKRVTLDLITSTEGATSFDATTRFDTYKSTSQHDYLDSKTTEYISTSSDIFTNSATDRTTIDKNIKKSYVQDSLEGFFDITETTMNTETTELNFQLHTAEFNDLTTEYYEDKGKTTEETVSTHESTELNDLIELINTTESLSHTSEFTTLATDSVSSATEDFNKNLSTKAPVFKNVETVDNVIDDEKNSNNSRTKSPHKNENEATTEAQDTSLTSTSISPNQVVVYV